MQYSSAILLVAFTATNVFAHGVIDSIKGANAVTMPGLSGKFVLLTFQWIQTNTFFPSRGRNSS
jgi:hypothetical protein